MKVEEMLEYFKKGNLEEVYKQLQLHTSRKAEIPDICKNCDVFQYGMSSENCNYCEGPKTFFYGDDD